MGLGPVWTGLRLPGLDWAGLGRSNRSGPGLAGRLVQAAGFGRSRLGWVGLDWVRLGAIWPGLGWSRLGDLTGPGRRGRLGLVWPVRSGPGEPGGAKGGVGRFPLSQLSGNRLVDSSPV